MAVYIENKTETELACYSFLCNLLHPTGLHCPNSHSLPSTQRPHTRRLRSAVVNYRCRQCRAVFNLFTDTLWAHTHAPCCTIVAFLYGIGLAIPLSQLSIALDYDTATLRNWYHQLQSESSLLCFVALSDLPYSDSMFGLHRIAASMQRDF